MNVLPNPAFFSSSCSADGHYFTVDTKSMITLRCTAHVSALRPRKGNDTA
jgi:hypothetical protein